MNSIRDIEIAPSSSPTTIRFQLSDFSFIDREAREWKGRKLRFTLTWVLDVPDAETGQMVHLGESMDGCLLTRHKDGNWQWSPPVTRMGSAYRNFIWITPDYYNYVLHALINTQYAAHLGPAFINEQSAVAKIPQNVDPTLPEVIDL